MADCSDVSADGPDRFRAGVDSRLGLKARCSFEALHRMEAEGLRLPRCLG
jgi:hypothetical protein